MCVCVCVCVCERERERDISPWKTLISYKDSYLMAVLFSIASDRYNMKTINTDERHYICVLDFVLDAATC